MFRGRTVRLRHLVGFDHLVVLVSAPGREVSAIELATSRGGSDVRVGGEVLFAAALGDDLLDSQAVLDLKARLGELEEELAEAERWTDSERVSRSRAEIDAIAFHLAADLGLSGKSRRFGSPTERARVNVTKAIRSGIAKIAEASPDLGKHLTASVRTGTLCGYWPDPSSTIRWTVNR